MHQFVTLRLEQWRQFHSIDLDLSRQTTVLTGANGCGKTTILNVLSHHFGWNVNFVSTPFMGGKRKKKFFSDIRRLFLDEQNEPAGSVEVGELRYSNGITSKLLTPEGRSNNPQYQLSHQNKQAVVGMHIPSHRPAITYQQIDQIPTNPKSNQQHYQEFQQLLLQTYGSANVRNPGLILKQSLISLALFGAGNDYVQENQEYRELFEGFQGVLSILLPKSIGFRKIEIRMPDVVLVTDSGDFSLDAMSGGVSSLFGIAWQIHMYGADKEACTVIIDEPENHLHPSMQRTLLPNLERAFPKYRFIIATHSPFIVTSNKNANVFGLIHNEERQVISEHLEHADLASTPDRVLREILDVPTTIPVWVEHEIKNVLKKYQDHPDNEEKIKAIFSEFQRLGVSDSLSGFLGDGRGGDE
ncbi:AAA family ATPase [Aromatoleum evansii]|uniref:AAA family ATPase n=1 Tax=Aromatoleum evansii TaxID=59406 RepID=A0ABZ1AMU2_AROEV|nr:AAA family ATPase [Aromatoleum evansii]